MTVLPVPVEVPVPVVALPPVPVDVAVVSPVLDEVVALPPAPVVPVLDVVSEEQAKRATAEVATKKRWSEERDMSDPFP
jgi:hypothetical protein